MRYVRALCTGSELGIDRGVICNTAHLAFASRRDRVPPHACLVSICPSLSPGFLSSCLAVPSSREGPKQRGPRFAIGDTTETEIRLLLRTGPPGWRGEEGSDGEEADSTYVPPPCFLFLFLFFSSISWMVHLHLS